MADEEQPPPPQPAQTQQLPQKLPRPESTIAQNFAAELDSMFALSSDPAVDHLSQKVEEKKQTVTSGEQTLQQLEAKLRETEERLARVSRGNSPARQGLSTNDRQAAPADGPPKPSPLAGQLSRPPTAPQNDDRPTNGGSEYVMVDRNDGQQQAQRGYG